MISSSLLSLILFFVILCHTTINGSEAEITVEPSLIPSFSPSSEPSFQPSISPTSLPTAEPTNTPTALGILPTAEPTAEPTISPSIASSTLSVLPTAKPTVEPTGEPTSTPTQTPTLLGISPSPEPTSEPTVEPTNTPTNSGFNPTAPQSTEPSAKPTVKPTNSPTSTPTTFSLSPTSITPPPTIVPTLEPSPAPTNSPTNSPSSISNTPTVAPIMTLSPTMNPTSRPTLSPTSPPSLSPTEGLLPTVHVPTESPTLMPSVQPTVSTLVEFSASQEISGLDEDTYNSNTTAYNLALSSSIAACMDGVNPDNIDDLTVSDNDRRRKLSNRPRKNNVRKITAEIFMVFGENRRGLDESDSIETSYVVKVQTGDSSVGYDDLSSQLQTAVEDGQFNDYMTEYGEKYGATGLINATSSSVTTENLETSGSSSDDGLSDGEIAGIVIGVLAFVGIIGAITYFKKKDRSRHNQSDVNFHDTYGSRQSFIDRPTETRGSFLGRRDQASYSYDNPMISEEEKPMTAL